MYLSDQPSLDSTDGPCSTVLKVIVEPSKTHFKSTFCDVVCKKNRIGSTMLIISGTLDYLSLLESSFLPVATSGWILLIVKMSCTYKHNHESETYSLSSTTHIHKHTLSHNGLPIYTHTHTGVKCSIKVQKWSERGR